MAATVRVGFIGAGGFSQSRLIPNFKEIPGVELIAVANSTPESSSRVASEFGFQRPAADWRAVAEAPDIDAIVLGTRTDTHHSMIPSILDAGKHLLSMNALVRDADQGRDVVAAARKHAHLATLVYPAAAGPFYLVEDDLVRSYLDAGYVGDVLQAFVFWYTPFFGLGSMFAPAASWLGAHTRVFGYRKDLDGPSFEGPRGRPITPQINGALTELGSGALLSYQHTTFTDPSARARFEIRGTAGVLVCYAVAEGAYVVPESGETGRLFGAKHGDSELQPLPVPDGVNPTGPNVEVEFIAAVRGERAASAAIPRFWDALAAIEFANAWRESVDTGAWREIGSA